MVGKEGIWYKTLETVGEVVDFESHPGDPLVFFDGAYSRLG